MKRKKTMESDAINYSNKVRHPAHDDEQQQHCSCSNSRIATHRAAGIHDRYIQIRTRTSYSSVQLYNYIVSGSGTLLWNHTRRLTKIDKKRYPPPKKNGSTPGMDCADLILSRRASYLQTTRCFHARCLKRRDDKKRYTKKKNASTR